MAHQTVPQFPLRTLHVRGSEECSAAERKEVERITWGTGVGGVLSGIIQGEAAWDKRPLVLKGGKMTITRLLDPITSENSGRVDALQRTLDLLKATGAEIEIGSIPLLIGGQPPRNQLWVRRNYVSRTLVEELQQSRIAPSDIIRSVISELSRLHRTGSAHGHLTLGNVVIQSGTVTLVDHLITAGSPSYFPSLHDLPPEIRKGGELPRPASDLFGLGVLIVGLLPSLALEQYEVWEGLAEKLLYSPPSGRPSLLEIERQLAPAVRPPTATPAPSKVTAAITAGKVVQPEPVQEIKALPSTPINKTTTNKNYLVGALAACAVVVVLLILLLRNPTKGIPVEAYWLSGEVERLREVAELAVLSHDAEAIDVVVTSAQKNETPKLVNGALIRLAFDERWRSELSYDDTSLVLAVSLGSLLPSSAKQIAVTQKIHPGVIYAFLATSEVHSSGSHFKNFSPADLMQLPPPIGKIFSQLSKLGIKSVETSTVRAVSHILAGDFQTQVLDALFASDDKGAASDTNKKASQDATALAILDGLSSLVSQSPELAQALYEYLGSHPGPVRLLLEWFTQPSLAPWREVPPRDRLALALGSFPPTIKSFEQRVDLLTFPRRSVRAAAVATLATEPNLRASPELLAFLSDPSKMNIPRASLVTLLAAITGSGDASASLTAEWLKQEPPPAVVLEILVRFHAPNTLDQFQLQTAQYLTANRGKLKPTDDNLARLALHTEPLARALAYSFLDTEKPNHRLILEEAQKQETSPRLKKELEQRLG